MSALPGEGINVCYCKFLLGSWELRRGIYDMYIPTLSSQVIMSIGLDQKIVLLCHS